MKRGVSYGFIIGFVLTLLFVIGNALVSFRAANTLIENYERVVQKQRSIKAVEEVFSAVKDAETGQRGYLLTGNPVFLGPYNSALQNVDVSIETARALRADDPERMQQLTELEASIKDRMATLQVVIEDYQDDQQLTPGRTRLLETGRQQMDRIRQQVDEIKQEDQRRLDLRIAEAEASSKSSVATFLAANLVVLGLMIAVYWLIKRDVAARDEAAVALERAHEELEDKVRERTAELASANTELERSNRELQDFAFVASHDLQEPLRKIQAFGDRLRTVQGPKFDDQGRDYLERMHSAAGRMHTLINDLLTFSRVTTKAQPFERTDLNVIADEVLGDLEVRIHQSGATIERGELPTIDADPLQMRQLFQNVIANSLKFQNGDVPPHIEISAEEVAEVDWSRRAGPFYRIMFKDNGIGFDEKYLDRIFTPFQRLHGRGEYEGTGIGLAVCRKIVERHGGELTAESTPGEGSTFYATLPARHGS
jgi:signal transduction histidine kinase